MTAEVEWDEAAPAEAAPEELGRGSRPLRGGRGPAAPAIEEPEAPVADVEPAAAAVPEPARPAASSPGRSLLPPPRGRPRRPSRPASRERRRSLSRPRRRRSAAPRPDPLDLRERLLLPVQNRALRRVKEGIVELQNVALDSLRVTGGWEGLSAAAATLEAALDPVAEEGAEAGAAAAGAFIGGEAPAPVITARSGTLVRAMAGDLAGQVKAAVAGSSGAGPLEVAAAVARVFRAWRSDEAERWVRAVAYAAYHDSLLAGLAVSGVGCGRPGGGRAAVRRVPGGTRGSVGPGGPPAGGHQAAPRPSRLHLHGGAGVGRLSASPADAGEGAEARRASPPQARALRRTRARHNPTCVAPLPSPDPSRRSRDSGDADGRRPCPPARTMTAP